jgi:hypothetical protein
MKFFAQKVAAVSLLLTQLLNSAWFQVFSEYLTSHDHKMQKDYEAWCTPCEGRSERAQPNSKVTQELLAR